MKSTPCECVGAGWCTRHLCHKDEYWFQLCRRRFDYFRLWESGVDPSRSQPRAFAELPTCQHRGAQPIGHEMCELCGGRGIQISVFECAVFGCCTERRFRAKRADATDPQACTQCQAYCPATPGSD